jgi:hypothetical protein
MELLAESLQAYAVCCRFGGGGGSLPLPVDRCSVVVQVVGRALSKICIMHYGVMMGDFSS